MKWNVIAVTVLKVLDFVHDLLCPFFRNDIQKIEEKTDKK